MTTGLQHSLEISDRSATLYLAGTLAGGDAFPLRRVCRDIPRGVSTLRLDLHGVSALDDGAMRTIRSLVRYWRETRRGGFRLSFASQHLMATRVDAGPGATWHGIGRIGEGNAALTGMFL
jgi:ABC-type transporter Mla MlaB component